MSSSNQNNSTRNGKGRQKVNLVKIGNENNRQVTFSKRRAGVFKKASELSTLCGVEAAFIVFSPGNKAYSFGHPNVDEVANRFIGKIGSRESSHLMEAHHNAISKHIMEFCEVEHQLELEKNRGKELDQQMVGQMELLNKIGHQQLGKVKGELCNFINDLGTETKNPLCFNTQHAPQTNTYLWKEEVFQCPRPSRFNVPFDSDVKVPTYFNVPFNFDMQEATYFMSYGTKENMFKGKAPMIPNRSSSAIVIDGKATSHDMRIQTTLRGKNLEVMDLREAMPSDPDFIIPYDPTADISDIIIPYHSDGSFPMREYIKNF